MQIGKILTFFNSRNLKTELLVWEKLNPAPLCNGKYISDLEYIVYVHDKGSCFNNDAPFEFKKKCKMYPIVVSNDKVHPTQKPLGLFEKILLDYSKENDLILDCFGGSGTTAVACYNTNRRFICIEKDKEYYEKSIERLNGVKQQIRLF